ncbi:BNR repeat-containing protein [Psychromonas sp. CNPT3]|nr:BNR repeat-containing protein [Psychromonas sp. CNPT3]
MLFLCSSTFLIACNDSGSGENLASTDNIQTISNAKNSISGTAMDGYLNQAKVCLDINNDLTCTEEDGPISFTDEFGRYSLNIDKDIDRSQHTLIVEAIPGTTFDMDAPSDAIEKAYVFSAPANNANIVSPYSTLIHAISQQQGIDFKQAKNELAQQLNLNADDFDADYVASKKDKYKKMHVLAQGLTQIIQKSTQKSVDNGVARVNSRVGVQSKLAFLDISALKTKTDKLSGNNVAASLDAISEQSQQALVVKADEIEIINGKVQIQRPKPSIISEDDASNTLDWAWVGYFKQVDQYEYSLDSGNTWKKATTKPLLVGNVALAPGVVQLRLRTLHLHTNAGKIALSTQHFTYSARPAAPSSLTVNDANNSFDWTNVATYSHFDAYEYSFDGGNIWQDVQQKPQTLADLDLSVGELQIRVKPPAYSNLSAGFSTLSTVAMTQTPQTPSAPTLTGNDTTDLVDWDYIQGFNSPSDYEIHIKGTWKALTIKPYSVGNNTYASNSISIRVQKNINNARKAGDIGTLSFAFNKQANKPKAPENSIVNDALNSFDWTMLSPYTQKNAHEYSVDSGKTWQNVNEKPLFISDVDYAPGAICVRVRANIQNHNPVGEPLCSSAKYSITPSTPDAPTFPISDDNADTFSWQWTPGFKNASDYEVLIANGTWTGVDKNPYALIADESYAPGDINVRVKGDLLTGRAPSESLSNTNYFNPKPLQADAPSDGLVDDKNNTFNWTNVASFYNVSDYEYSLNAGQTWKTLSVKPLHVSEVELSIGRVQVRVKANVKNGMPAGFILENHDAFMAELGPDAPQNLIIVNHDKTRYKDEVKTNGLKWSFVVDSTTGANYQYPTYYEFTNDKGTTWTTAISNPQHIGTQAYAKGNVGIRVKANAIDGKNNSPGKVMWANSASGSFLVIRLVPISDWDKAPYLLSKDAQYSSLKMGGWRSTRPTCFAEYGPDGKGNARFWTKKSVYSKTGIASELQKSACGISDWKLLSVTELAARFSKDLTFIPKFAMYNVISKTRNRYWASMMENNQLSFVKVSEGKVATGYSFSTASLIATWVAPANNN